MYLICSSQTSNLRNAGNLRTTDKGGPYNLTLLPVQVNEIKGAPFSCLYHLHTVCHARSSPITNCIRCAMLARQQRMHSTGASYLLTDRLLPAISSVVVLMMIRQLNIPCAVTQPALLPALTTPTGISSTSWSMSSAWRASLTRGAPSAMASLVSDAGDACEQQHLASSVADYVGMRLVAALLHRCT